MADQYENKIVGAHPSMAQAPHNASISRSQACGPQRLRLSRKAGWRKPEGAVVVSRPTRWGNPWTIHQAGSLWFVLIDKTRRVGGGGFDTAAHARRFAVTQYRRWLTEDEFAGNPGRAWILGHLHELAGRDLLCWCPLPGDGENDWCHARVLVDLAAAYVEEKQ